MTNVLPNAALSQILADLNRFLEVPWQCAHSRVIIAPSGEKREPQQVLIETDRSVITLAQSCLLDEPFSVDTGQHCQSEQLPRSRL